MKIREVDYKTFVMSMFLTTIVVAFFLATVTSVIVAARRNRQARIAALDAQNNVPDVVALKPLKECRAIVVEMPDGGVFVGCPPESETSSPDAMC
jgi:hypothetical protein